LGIDQALAGTFLAVGQCLDADFGDTVTFGIASRGFDVDKGKNREFGGREGIDNF
jgi:hypothetical protein